MPTKRDVIDNFVVALDNSVLVCYSERSGGPRRELSSVSSFSDDEGVSEPCAAAAEISRQEEPPAPPPPRGPFTAASPMFLEAGIDPKCLQRNHSLPSPARRTSLTAAERSHSWDHTQTHEHTTALHLPKCPLACLNTAYIPPYAKCVSPPQQESISTSSQNSALDRTTKEMEASVPDPAAQIAGRCSFCEEVTAKTESPSEPEVKSNSISAAIKSKVIGFFQRSFSPKPNSSSSQEQSDLPRRSKAKDEEYRKLVEYIMREEAELLHCERPALEHTVSAPESSEVFAVREFPMSSQVLTRRKSRSLDEPPVIVPPRVRRKSRSLDEPPRIELLEESNESAEASDGEGDPEPLIEDKIMEAEQSCDSGNQSDSGAADPVVSEEPSSLGDLPSPAHTRNDSGTVVEENVTKEEDDDNDTADEMDRDKENDTADDESSSDSEEEEAGVEENGEECEREKVEKLNLEAAEPVECCETSAPRRRGSLPDGRVANIISDIVLPPERAARRSSLQSSHKKLSPVASTGSERSSAGEAETDCDEWARTTEAVIRSMQNQMLRRQSAIEDFIIDFDRFTTSSSGDSRLGQLTYEDISNGACSQSPPLPPRRGSEASTISSEGVSATESPSDVDDLDVWKSKADSPSEVSPDKAFQLPSHSFHVNGEKSSSSSSSNSPTESPPSGEQPTYHRFYHVFRQGELVDLIERHVDNLHVLSCYYDHANWCVIAEKVQVWRI